MALLSALCAIRAEPLFCLHVEHGLRSAEESLADAEFVRAFCKERGIECRVEHIPPGKIAGFARRKGLGIEAAARFFRHRALSAQAAQLGENTFILPAHTKDDMQETILMRVLRGSGPAGLAAMPERRGKILRPLLSMTRADVIAYLEAKKIPWREDLSNADEKFLRNKIRRKLVPFLDEMFPDWKSGVFCMAQTQSLAAEFIAKEAQHRVVWEFKKKKQMSKTPCSSLFTSEENFFAQSQIIREEALFLAIDRLLKGRKNFATVKRSVVRRFCLGRTNAADLGPLAVRKEGGKVLLSRARGKFSETGFSLLIKEPGLYNLNNISIEVRPNDCHASGGFFAALPVVFRRCFNDDFISGKGKKVTARDLAKNVVCAADRFGTAAFIEADGLIGRDFSPEADSRDMCIVKVKRFADV